MLRHRTALTSRAGTVLATISGSARSILTAERVALNFLGPLSGTATATAALVKAVEGTGTRIVCTRKTLPGLRALQKYAVRCGGGFNHRFGLDDAAMIKDNHVAGCRRHRARHRRACARGSATWSRSSWKWTRWRNWKKHSVWAWTPSCWTI